MAKLVSKGLAKDKTYISLKCLCTNGIDTYTKRFLIKKEHEIFVGYGCYTRTPDFYITIFNVKYACFYADGKNIIIPYTKEHGEFDGLCFPIQ